MNQVFDPFNIIILAVAVIIFFRLRAVLGTRTGHEKPFDPFAGENDDAQSSSSDNVVPLPGRNKPTSISPPDSAADDDESEDDRKPIWQGYARKGSAVAKGIEDLAMADNDFSPREFLGGARMAYEMIVNAFAEGDKQALKPLLSREVYDGFAAAIDERKKQGHTLESKFVGISKADISKISLAGGDAQVSIKFVSDLITATLDEEGRVIDGDPSEIQEITDVWTFERPVNSRDPNWRLIATEAD
ncbi:MAG: Tim44/TimA family putative adaptor protein [Anderseniella sp.]|jgi:predicted lipid-binding transport protein (Tim44 family)